MPELPEVETIVHDLLGADLLGCGISSADVIWPGTIAGIHPTEFSRLVQGKVILGIRRRAKYIIFELSERLYLIVHLRMTGRFELNQMSDVPGRHIHVSLLMEDHRRIDFHDTRKFGRFYLVPDPMQICAPLGPEPLADDFTAARFHRMTRSHRRSIKPLLLDQHFLAGIGNIYADEALWTARIHPLQAANLLAVRETKRLHRAIRVVLRQGISNAGTTLGKGKTNFYSIQGGKGTNANHLKVFRRVGKPCPRCQSPIRRTIVGQRSTHICETCQRLE